MSGQPATTTSAAETAVASVVHGESGRKATFVHGVDATGTPAELREWNGSPIIALTAARAKRAGL